MCVHKGNPNPRCPQMIFMLTYKQDTSFRNYTTHDVLVWASNKFALSPLHLSHLFSIYHEDTIFSQCKLNSVQCIGLRVETESCIRLASFPLSSLSLIIVPHKLKVLSGNVINVMNTILHGGVGNALREPCFIN